MQINARPGKVQKKKDACTKTAQAAFAAEYMMKDIYKCSHKSMVPFKMSFSDRLGLTKEIEKAMLTKLGCSWTKEKDAKSNRILQYFGDKGKGRYRGMPNWRDSNNSRKDGGYVSHDDTRRLWGRPNFSAAINRAKEQANAATGCDKKGSTS